MRFVLKIYFGMRDVLALARMEAGKPVKKHFKKLSRQFETGQRELKR